MKLCFGTFASVLNCCRSNINQANFIGKLAGILDPYSRYIEDPQAVSKLLNCIINFRFSDGAVLSKEEQGEVYQKFIDNILPFLDKDKKPYIILTLLDIIRKDKSIETYKKDSFRYYFGFYKRELLEEGEFTFSKFVVDALLYTTCEDIDNQETPHYPGGGIKEYVDKIWNLYQYRHLWNPDSELIELFPTKIYQIFEYQMKKNEIQRFIEKVDPTVFLREKWIDLTAQFTDAIESNALIYDDQYSTLSGEEIILTIREFSECLDKYMEYLAKNMITFSARVWYPTYRSENTKWAQAFKEETSYYRRNLGFLAGKIKAEIEKGKQENMQGLCNE